MDKSDQKTIRRLQNLIQKTNDFPILSHTIDIVTKLTSSTNFDYLSITEITNSILNDFALTNKILKLVNTVYYRQYDGKINTISRAVMLIGFKQLRNIAISLMLFEHLKDKSTAVELKENIVLSFMSAIFARELSKNIDFKEYEEAYICAMFHNLGKLLVAFYIPLENKKIKGVITNKKMNEESAARKVLDISYQDIGVTFANDWGFPPKIIKSIYKLPLTHVPKPFSTDDILHSMTCFSNELCLLIANKELKPSERNDAIDKLLIRYKDCFDVSDDMVTDIIKKVMEEAKRYEESFNLNFFDASVKKQVSKFMNDKQSEKSKKQLRPKPLRDAVLNSEIVQVLDYQSTTRENGTASSPESILDRGIQEVTNILIEDYSINEILRVILEIMYTGMGFSRVLICFKNTKEPVVEGRFGFGNEIQDVKKVFLFYLDKPSDIFSLSLSKAADILVKDINDEKVKNYIPAWYREKVKAETFIVFPLMIGKKPIGIIYADKPKAGEIDLSPKLLSYLKTLRNQAIMALKRA